MNKEEIEKAKPVLEKIKRHIEYQETIEKIEEYIQCLEQKESILDKVTDKLKEIRRELDDDRFGYYAQEVTKILNIIEGGI